MSVFDHVYVFALLTPEETAKYDELLRIADPTGSGQITPSQAGAFFPASGLSQENLASIWNVANSMNAPALDRAGFFVALRLVAAAQSGNAIDTSRLSARNIRLPVFHNLPPAPPPPQTQNNPVGNTQLSSSSSTTTAPPAGNPSSALPLQSPPPGPWTLTPDNLTSYRGWFGKYDADGDGFVAGGEVQGLFAASGLKKEDLAVIWNLADTAKQGKLDFQSFAFAMHMINAVRAGAPVPSSLPQELPSSWAVLQAGGGSPAGPTSQMTGSSWAAAGTGVVPSRTGASTNDVPIGIAPLGIQHTGASRASTMSSSATNSMPPPMSMPPTTSAPPAPAPAAVVDPGAPHWEVTPAQFAEARGHFEKLPKTEKGNTAAAAAVRGFYALAQLKDEDLDQVMRIIDMESDSDYDVEEFAVGYVLVMAARKENKEIPVFLPNSYKPPSRRPRVAPVKAPDSNPAPTTGNAPPNPSLLNTSTLSTSSLPETSGPVTPTPVRPSPQDSPNGLFAATPPNLPTPVGMDSMSPGLRTPPYPAMQAAARDPAAQAAAAARQKELLTKARELMEQQAKIRQEVKGLLEEEEKSMEGLSGDLVQVESSIDIEKIKADQLQEQLNFAQREFDDLEARQKEKTALLAKLAEDYRNGESKLFQMQSDITQAEVKVSKLNDEVYARETSLASETAKNATIQSKLDNAAAAAAAAEARVQELDAKIAKMQSDMVANEESVEAKGVAARAYAEQEAELRVKLQQVEAQWSLKQHEKEGVDTEVAGARSQLESQQEQLKSKVAEKEKLEADIEAAHKRLEELKSDWRSVRSQYEETRKATETTKQEQDRLQGLINQGTENLDTVRNALKEQNLANQAVIQDYRKVKSERKRLVGVIQHLGEDLAKAKRDHADMQAQLSADQRAQIMVKAEKEELQKHIQEANRLLRSLSAQFNVELKSASSSAARSASMSTNHPPALGLTLSTGSKAIADDMRSGTSGASLDLPTPSSTSVAHAAISPATAVNAYVNPDLLQEPAPTPVIKRTHNDRPPLAVHPDPTVGSMAVALENASIGDNTSAKGAAFSGSFGVVDSRHGAGSVGNGTTSNAASNSLPGSNPGSPTGGKSDDWAAGFAAGGGADFSAGFGAGGFGGGFGDGGFGDAFGDASAAPSTTGNTVASPAPDSTATFAKDDEASTATPAPSGESFSGQAPASGAGFDEPSSAWASFSAPSEDTNKPAESAPAPASTNESTAAATAAPAAFENGGGFGDDNFGASAGATGGDWAAFPSSNGFSAPPAVPSSNTSTGATDPSKGVSGGGDAAPTAPAPDASAAWASFDSSPFGDPAPGASDAADKSAATNGAPAGGAAPNPDIAAVAAAAFGSPTAADGDDWASKAWD